MSNETESLSAILASARTGLADDSWIDEITEPDEDGQPNDYARRVVPLDDVLAALDRIEAAAERERETAGNAAAMRDALERIVGCCEGCHADACEKVCRPELTSESIHAALAALAAPARNCDRCATYEEALKAYRAWTEQNTGSVSNVSGRGMIGWLFAPAEGEGGDHA